MLRFSSILTLAAKDWAVFWADRRAAVLAFVVPIVLASAFGLIFDRPITTDASVRLPMLLVAEGDSPFVRQLVADIQASTRVEVELVTRETVDQRLRDRRPGVAVMLPKQFQTGSEPPRLEIRHHPLCALEAQWAEGVMTECIMKRFATEKLGPLVSQVMLRPPFETETIALTGPRTKFNSYSHSFCGMTLQYLLFWGMESGLLLLRERQRGVWHRLRAAPIPFSTILLGKALATAAIAVLQVLATFTFGYLVFNVSVDGSIGAFVLMVIGVSLFSAAIGLLVAAIGGTETRARSISILAILGISMVGGLWLPTFLLPGWLRDLSLVLPTTWAMRGLDGVTWHGLSFLEVLPSLAALLGFTLLFAVAAFWQFARNESRHRRGARG